MSKYCIIAQGGGSWPCPPPSSLSLMCTSCNWYVAAFETYNLSLDCPISKLKDAFRSSLKGLSNDVFWLEFCDWSKSVKIDKTEGYSLAFFLQNELFWQLPLRAYNLCLDCPISKLKCAFSSSWEGLSNDVFRLEFCCKSKSVKFLSLIVWIHSTGNFIHIPRSRYHSSPCYYGTRCQFPIQRFWTAYIQEHWFWYWLGASYSSGRT